MDFGHQREPKAAKWSPVLIQLTAISIRFLINDSIPFESQLAAGGADKSTNGACSAMDRFFDKPRIKPGFWWWWLTRRDFISTNREQLPNSDQWTYRRLQINIVLHTNI